MQLLREHIRTYEISPEGRLFRTGRGDSIQDSTYAAVWRKARLAGFTPGKAASPLVARPYDLRHAAISLWLNAGVPATEVVRRPGHGVGRDAQGLRELRGWTRADHERADRGGSACRSWKT